MYSRYSNRPEKPLHIPKDYSGCAFSDRHTDAPQSRYLEIARPTPITPPKDSPLPEKENIPLPEPDEAAPSIPTVCEEPPVLQPSKENPELPAPFQGLFGHLGAALPFANGMEFDQLLILGLILLLLKNEQDPDIVLWLGLLLLCG